MNNKARGFFGERPLPTFEVDPQVLRRRTRRDVLLFGAGAVAALAGAEIDSCRTLFVSTMMWPNRSTRHIVRYRLTPNRKLPRSRTTTTERLPIPGISLDGI